MRSIDFSVCQGRFSLATGGLINIGICLLFPGLPVGHDIRVWVNFHAQIAAVLVFSLYPILILSAVAGLLARGTMAGKFGFVFSVLGLMFFQAFLGIPVESRHWAHFPRDLNHASGGAGPSSRPNESSLRNGFNPAVNRVGVAGRIPLKLECRSNGAVATG